MSDKSEKRNVWLTRLAKPYRLATANSRRYPDFIIIGAQKAGTSSVYEYMVQHPDIVKASRKEIHFFDWAFFRGSNWYKSHFPKLKNNNHTLTGEASPLYLYHPESAKRIYETLEDVRLIVLLRNPVDRAIAHYRHEVRKGNESKSIGEAFNRHESSQARFEEIVENPDAFTLNDQCFSYIPRGFYHAQIQNYLKYFNLNQMFFLESDRFFESPETSVQEIWKFLELELPNSNTIDWSPMNVNPNKRPEIDDGLIEKLTSIYDPHNEKLFGLMGTEFNWRY